jgi:hypothetical protein
MVHVKPLVDVHPVHDPKTLDPAIEGAVRLTLVPLLYIRVKLVLPELLPLLSTTETPMPTPLAGLVELTVKL